jgi:dihydrodipicolinate synthase/N-acetylneuraminate lyase
MRRELSPAQLQLLHRGTVIPAHPLALTAERSLDERHQRALTRYYLAAGAGGLAVGVHTTQFAIRDVGLLAPVLRLASETIDASIGGRPFLKIAGVLGPRAQALRETDLALSLGYDLALLSLRGLNDSEEGLLEHCAAIAERIPVVGFYLQTAVGGRRLSHDFWRAFADIDGVVAIKIAPFDRYATLDVVRAVCASDRNDRIALYTGNDDTILTDLLTPYRVRVGGRTVEKRIVGGLLGQWAVWTRAAVELLAEVHALGDRDPLPRTMLDRAARLTDANAVVFDAANGFHGVIAGVHEVLRLQGLLAGIWCLDPAETLSPGQAEAIARVRAEHPDLVDDAFVAAHLREWLN